jgi:serine/threonine protein phosphatase 1
MPRILTIGDVHGCQRALAALLACLAIASDDTVIFLGDVVDRGPDTRGAIDAILDLQRRCRVVSLMGNHEEAMRNALSGRGPVTPWLDIGGRETLASYGGAREQIPPTHIRWLVSTAPYWESEHEIFVHAGLESDVSLKNQTSDHLRWRRLETAPRPHVSGKRVICGHTPQEDGRPKLLPGYVLLDTFAHAGGWLSCLDVATDEVSQANEKGQFRRLQLADCV